VNVIFVMVVEIYFVVSLQVFQANPLVDYYPAPDNESCFGNDSDNDSIPVDNSFHFVTASVLNNSFANETANVTCSSFDEHTARPNTALLSLILTLTTFLLALALKEFRNSHFLGRNVSVQDFVRSL